jgi:acid stress-induced BolA-like protein IbaG/YrbA
VFCFSIKVVAKAFEEKNAVTRQRLVYKCIWEEMSTDQVHAVRGMEAMTPAESIAKGET